MSLILIYFCTRQVRLSIENVCKNIPVIQGFNAVYYKTLIRAAFFKVRPYTLIIVCLTE